MRETGSTQIRGRGPQLTALLFASTPAEHDEADRNMHGRQRGSQTIIAI